ncbi:MAG: HAD-IA family hydrolase [Dehalococcoidia bacterium]|nr:HAD-IA family hydrolase [Dehalococcoidia bacterium]
MLGGMTKPRAVLFDIGSTLWRSPPEHPDALTFCYGQGLLILAQNMPTPPEIDPLIETVEGYLAEWEEIWRTDAGQVEQRPTAEFVAEALKRLNLSLAPRPLAAFTDMIMETSVFTAMHEPPEPGMKEAMVALNRVRGLRLGCVSNAFMSAITLHRIMEERGFGPYLDLTVSSCDLGIRKPHPAIYEDAVKKMGFPAEETIFVGDRLDADIEGPAALGMRTVLSHQYRQEDPAKARVQPGHVIGHLSELPGYIDTLIED